MHNKYTYNIRFGISELQFIVILEYNGMERRIFNSINSILLKSFNKKNWYSNIYLLILRDFFFKIFVLIFL